MFALCEHSIGSNVETLYHILDGKAEALEFVIRENCPVLGKTLSELNLKKNLLVGCLHRTAWFVFQEVKIRSRLVIL